MADAKKDATKDVAKTAAVAAEKAKSAVAARVAAIEARWGKSIQEVLCDIHDHIFGATPEEGGSEAIGTEEVVDVGGEKKTGDVG